ncbi:conserved hypothetical protein [Mesorhizobium sp. SOD10]|nr:conserved hypothetical protein [Mesorhizobium sp. SOD10]
MPLVKVDLYPGRSTSQKREVGEGITRVFVEKLGSAPQDVIVIFNDTPAHDWFAGGQPMFRPASRSPSAA